MNVVGTDLIEEFCKRKERAKKAFDKWPPKVGGPVLVSAIDP